MISDSIILIDVAFWGGRTTYKMNIVRLDKSTLEYWVSDSEYIYEQK